MDSVNPNQAKGGWSLKGPGQTVGPGDTGWSAALRIWQQGRAVRIVAAILGALLGLGGVVGWLWVGHLKQRAAAIDLDAAMAMKRRSVFVDAAGQEVTRLFVEDRRMVRLADMAPWVSEAICAIEDKRFRDHAGVDYRGIVRAAVENFLAGRVVQGGSTLTQQLAKHWLGDFSRSLERKVLEVFIAHRIEERFSKDEILELYLNQIYFGSGYWGIGAAAEGYFGVRPAELNLAQAALLAGLVKAPSEFSPRRDLQAALERRGVVLDEMASQGRIEASQRAAADSEAVRLQPRRPVGVFAHYQVAAIEEVESRFGVGFDELIERGLSVQLTVDGTLQRAMEDAVSEAVRAAGGGTIDGGLIVADRDGAVRAMVGSADFERSQFDRVRQASRDASSALFPIVASGLADRARLTGASVIGSGRPGPSGSLTLGEAFASGVPWALRALEETVEQAGQVIPERDRFAKRAVEGRVWSATLWEITHWLHRARGGQGRLHFVAGVRDAEGGLLVPRDSDGSETGPKPWGDFGRAMWRTAAEFGPQAAREAQIPGWASRTVQGRDGWFVGWGPRWVMGAWLGDDAGRALGEDARAGVANMVNKAASGLAAWNPAERDEGEVAKEAEPGSDAGMSRLWINAWTGSPHPPHRGAATGIRMIWVPDVVAMGAWPAVRTELGREAGSWLKGLWKGSGVAEPHASAAANPSGESRYPGEVVRFVPARRGAIMSSDGIALATTIDRWWLSARWPRELAGRSGNDAVSWLRHRLFSLRDHPGVGTLGRRLFVPDDAGRRFELAPFEPILLTEVTASELILVERSGLLEAGFALVPIPERQYPLGSVAAHVVGGVRRMDRRATLGKVEADDRATLEMKGFTGLEERWNDALTGVEGRLRAVLRNGFGEGAWLDQTPRPGAQIETWIDAGLQQAASEALTRNDVDRGAVVVMDIAEGGILAMVSAPSFDPGELGSEMSAERWHALSSQPPYALMNRAIAFTGPPGSSFKPVTALAAMRSGVWDRYSPFETSGTLDLGGVVYRAPKEVGVWEFDQAMVRSGNLYFITLGVEAGREAMLQTCEAAGFGRRSGIDLPGEVTGFVPTPEWVLDYHKRWFGDGDVANLSIGQGDLLVTPLQMACLYSQIARRGSPVTPRIVRRIVPVGPGLPPAPTIMESSPRGAPTGGYEMLCFGSQWQALWESMQGVVERGTGRQAFVQGLAMCGKTGTAQVGSKDRPRQLAWFCGFAPASGPRLAFAVMIEGDFDQSLSGGRHAGRVAADMFKALAPEARARLLTPGALFGTPLADTYAVPHEPALNEGVILRAEPIAPPLDRDTIDRWMEEADPGDIWLPDDF